MTTGDRQGQRYFLSSVTRIAELAEQPLPVSALERAGLKVTVLSALEDYPDSVFVEDAALCVPEATIMMRPGRPSRMKPPFWSLRPPCSWWLRLAISSATTTIRLRRGASLGAGYARV